MHGAVSGRHGTSCDPRTRRSAHAPAAATAPAASSRRRRRRRRSRRRGRGGRVPRIARRRRQRVRATAGRRSGFHILLGAQVVENVRLILRAQRAARREGVGEKAPRIRSCRSARGRRNRPSDPPRAAAVCGIFARASRSEQYVTPARPAPPGAPALGQPKTSTSSEAVQSEVSQQHPASHAPAVASHGHESPSSPYAGSDTRSQPQHEAESSESARAAVAW